MRRGQIEGAYPATRGDAMIIYIGVSDLIHMEGEVPLWQQLMLRPALVIGGMIDMPISLVTDTLLLPYDLMEENQPDEHQE